MLKLKTKPTHFNKSNSCTVLTNSFSEIINCESLFSLLSTSTIFTVTVFVFNSFSRIIKMIFAPELYADLNCLSILNLADNDELLKTSTFKLA